MLKKAKADHIGEVDMLKKLLALIILVMLLYSVASAMTDTTDQRPSWAVQVEPTFDTEPHDYKCQPRPDGRRGMDCTEQ